MALTVCKECGHKISSQAAACPSCGAPIVHARRTNARLIVVISVIVVAVIVIVSNQSTSTGGKNPVKTSAALTGSAVVITNLDDFTWSAVTVYVNGTPLDGYSAGPYGPIVPNRQLSIPFTEFVRGDLRFNAYQRKINQVIVSVDGHDAPIFSFQ